MPRTSEPSEPAKALPHPELNPLENPLLSENMHRWAEVYFNNPPERRDAAVVELLEELLEERRQRAEQSRRTIPTPIAQPRVVPTSSANHEKLVHCPACRTANPATHQFCGMCGQTLQAEEPRAKNSETSLQEQNGQSAVVVPTAEPQSPTQEFQEEAASDQVQEFDGTPEGEEYASGYGHETRSFPPAYASNDLSLFQSLRAPADEGEEDWEYGPQRSGSYRYYVAVVLTILILGLGYLAWHSAQASQASREASPLPATPVTENAQPSTPAASSPKVESSQPDSAKNATQPSASNTAAASSDNTPEPVPPKQKENALTKASATQRIAPESATPKLGHSGPGTDELATAQRYLSGTDGHGRDSTEGAKWLWKAISKHNGPATLMLADLYLKGDGVAKNCDQGRVLLDSAAQRGIAGAGERLRNLQAFGCR